MDLRRLEIFCRVCEEKSFSRAGERLRLAQPTISGHVKSLEEYFDAPLLERLGRTVEPTPAGALLYRHGRRLLELKRATIQAMDGFLHRLEGRLHLGASTIPGEYLLPARIGRFRESHPEIQITLKIRDTRETLERVIRGEVDLGFVGAPLEDPRLELRAFDSDRLILVAPPVPSWDRFGGKLDLGTLRRMPLLVREEGSGTRMTLERELQRLGHRLDELKVVAELGSTAAIKEAVKAGLGASFISARSVEAELGAGWMRRLQIPEVGRLERSFWSVVNTERVRSPLLEAFLEFLSAGAEAAA